MEFCNDVQVCCNDACGCGKSKPREFELDFQKLTQQQKDKKSLHFLSEEKLQDDKNNEKPMIVKDKLSLQSKVDVGSKNEKKSNIYDKDVEKPRNTEENKIEIESLSVDREKGTSIFDKYNNLQDEVEELRAENKDLLKRLNEKNNNNKEEGKEDNKKEEDNEKNNYDDEYLNKEMEKLNLYIDEQNKEIAKENNNIYGESQKSSMTKKVNNNKLDTSSERQSNSSFNKNIILNVNKNKNKFNDGSEEEEEEINHKITNKNIINNKNEEEFIDKDNYSNDFLKDKLREELLSNSLLNIETQKDKFLENMKKLDLEIDKQNEKTALKYVKKNNYMFNKSQMMGNKKVNNNNKIGRIGSKKSTLIEENNENKKVDKQNSQENNISVSSVKQVIQMNTFLDADEDDSNTNKSYTGIKKNNNNILNDNLDNKDKISESSVKQVIQIKDEFYESKGVTIKIKKNIKGQKMFVINDDEYHKKEDQNSYRYDQYEGIIVGTKEDENEVKKIAIENKKDLEEDDGFKKVGEIGKLFNKKDESARLSKKNTKNSNINRKKNASSVNNKSEIEAMEAPEPDKETAIKTDTHLHNLLTRLICRMFDIEKSFVDKKKTTSAFFQILFERSSFKKLLNKNYDCDAIVNNYKVFFAMTKRIAQDCNAKDVHGLITYFIDHHSPDTFYNSIHLSESNVKNLEKEKKNNPALDKYEYKNPMILNAPNNGEKMINKTVEIMEMLKLIQNVALLVYTNKDSKFDEEQRQHAKRMLFLFRQTLTILHRNGIISNPRNDSKYDDSAKKDEDGVQQWTVDNNYNLDFNLQQSVKTIERIDLEEFIWQTCDYTRGTGENICLHSNEVYEEGDKKCIYGSSGFSLDRSIKIPEQPDLDEINNNNNNNNTALANKKITSVSIKNKDEEEKSVGSSKDTTNKVIKKKSNINNINKYVNNNKNIDNNNNKIINLDNDTIIDTKKKETYVKDEKNIVNNNNKKKKSTLIDLDDSKITSTIITNNGKK